MGVYRFEDLRVWQAAKAQCDRVGELIKRPEFERDAALSDQMNRAALSVMFNISEGFLRRRDRETGQFLTARELEDCVQKNESIARMLRRWEATLDLRTKDQGRTKHQGQGTKDET